MTKLVRQALGMLCVAALALAIALVSTNEGIAGVSRFIAFLTGGVALLTLALELLKD